MYPWEIIKKLESDNSRLFKEEVVKDNMNNSDFVKGLKLALNPLITFGTRDVPVSTVDGGELSWSDFEILANKLKERHLTGHAARDAIIDTMNLCDKDAWNYWYRRIILKDLKCGVSEKTVNKIQKNTIPIFGCMLARDGSKDEKRMVGDVIIENKYDGVRCIAIVQNNSATLYSRNGKVFPNFPHIEEALSKSHFNNMVFDGEIMSENFQALMKQVYRKSDVQTEDAYLALFDVVDLEEFNIGKSTLTTLERKEVLENMIFTDCIKEVEWTRCNLDTDAGKKTFKQMNKEAINNGYEGLMVKPVNAFYECKRSPSWLKVKPIIEVTLTVVDVEEGQGKYEGTTGALVCEGIDDGVTIGVNVGSGLTDDVRESVWKDKENVIGQLVEIRADAITQAENGEYSLRFPRFKTFRGFDKNEKI